MYETVDTFWSEYIKFNNNNDPFDSNVFNWSIKDILNRIVIYVIKNTVYHPPKFFVF